MDQVNLNEIEKNRGQSPERALVEIPRYLQAHLTVENWNLLTHDQRDMLMNIDKLPEQLFGIVPESVWDTLGVGQKLEFIYTHELLKRPEDMDPGQSREQSEEEEYTDFRHQVEGSGDQSTIETSQTHEQGGESLGTQFESVKKEISNIEKESFSPEQEEYPEQQDELIPPDDIESIQNSTGATFAEDPMPRLAGYQPDDSFLSTVEERVNGDPKNSGTWAANIIEKFWNTFRSSQ